MAREFLARRDVVLARLAEIPGVQHEKPEGAFYVFPDFSAHFGRRGPDGDIASGNDLGAYLLRHASVATVPGEGFGAPSTSGCRTPRSSPSSKRGCCGFATAWRASPEAHPAVYCQKQKRRRLITLAFFERRWEQEALLAARALAASRARCLGSRARQTSAARRLPRPGSRPRWPASHRLPQLAHAARTLSRARRRSINGSHACKCLLHAHHLLMNVCRKWRALLAQRAGAAASQRLPPHRTGSPPLRPSGPRLRRSSRRRFACSTSFLPAQPIAIVLTSASAAMLAPNLRAFIPTHLLCPESSRGGLGKATPFCVTNPGTLATKRPDGSGKASHGAI